jgi:hypothetical protein
MIDKPGVYEISNEEYHKDPCIEPSLSRGTLVDLLYKSPAHAFANHPRFTPQKPDNDKKYDIGQSAHGLFLEGIDKCVVVDADDWRTKAAKEQRDAAYAEGKTPLLAKQYDEVVEMVKTATWALANSELHLQISWGTSEHSIFWNEGNTWLRIRPDWFNAGSMERQLPAIILDYKTSESANPEAFCRKAISLGYDIQEAFYKRGFRAIYGVEPMFIFMVQEITAPYLCSFISLDPQFQDEARKKVERGINLWKYCIQTNDWFGYPTRVCHVEMPAWAMNWGSTANYIDAEVI